MTILVYWFNLYYLFLPRN
ncbi:cytochrome c oxidase subunit 2A [Aureivirga marina]